MTVDARGAPPTTGRTRVRRTPLGSLRQLVVLELKLFLREPLTVLFTLAMPLILLYVLGGVFGNTPDPTMEVYRGVGAMTYYVPAYVALVIASMGVIGLPVHLAAYREQGVLRRLRASSMPTWSVIVSQLAVTVTLSAVGSLAVVLAAQPSYGVGGPEDLLGVVVAFVVGALAFAAFGVLLGAVLPTARAAQAAGLLLWFVLLMISGVGPPPEVLTTTMQRIATLTPLYHLVIAVQDPWLGFGWNVVELAIVAAIGVGSAALALVLFRWE